MQNNICCFCNKEYEGCGNDIRPLVTYSLNGDRCCDFCNSTIVIPNRLKFWPGLFGYAIKDKETGKLINQYGLSTECIKTLEDECVMIFGDEELAKHHMQIDQLFHHEVVRIQLREDN